MNEKKLKELKKISILQRSKMGIKQAFNQFKMHQAYNSHIHDTSGVCECGFCKNINVLRYVFKEGIHKYPNAKKILLISLYAYKKKILYVSNVQINQYYLEVDPYLIFDLFKNKQDYINQCKQLDKDWEPPFLTIIPKNLKEYIESKRRKV